VTAVPLCYYGSPDPLPARHPLRAGPLTLFYEASELRYVRLGEREVIRRWYAAVRDHNWGTVPATLTRERIETTADTFRITFDAEHRQGAIDFVWQGEIAGDAHGTLTFTMNGEVRTTFQRNRLGFCVLHPICECAGAPCRVETADGVVTESHFPREIAPRNPFCEMRRFAHEVAHGLWAELSFEGDLFEMEDQRNWIDASFKTFCTPLRLPFPVELASGTRVRQRVTLRLLGDVPAQQMASLPERGDGATCSLTIAAVRNTGCLPVIGLCSTSHGQLLSSRERQRLRLLHPAHLRVDVDLTASDGAARLRQAAAQAQDLETRLELALTLSDAAWEETAALIPLLQEIDPPLRRVLVFHNREWATPARILTPAVEAIARLDASIPVYAGTTANFAELNRGRPPASQIDGICYAAHPQEHAFDNASLVEAVAALPDTVATARSFCGDLPVAVTPLTLRRRVNPYATGPVPPVAPGELPPRVDLRQMSLFGAGWTLGSLKYLAESGVGSVTYYETTGWFGVMETEQGCPLPEQFPSRPGMVFPLYHVLADAGELAGAEVLPVASSQPLAFDGLACARTALSGSCWRASPSGHKR
jgi:D-apionolactonase